MKENVFSLLIPMALVLCLGVGAIFFMPHSRPTHEIAKTQVEIQNEVKLEAEQPDTFNKKYQVLYTYDENISFRGVPRYTRKIKIKLGLSAEELEANLIHAAWEMQKEKNAKGVIIFAYRADDIQCDMYSAGKCILAPFGEWDKATDRSANSVLNLKPVIDIAEVYFKNIPPILKVKTNVIINMQNTMLHKDSNIDTDNVITTLKKGLKAIIVDGKRTFSTDDFLDVYKIRFTVKGNKTTAGWVLGNNLDVSQTISNTQNASRNQKHTTSQEKYANIQLLDQTIADWKKAKTEDKMLACEVFILAAISTNYSKIKITDIDNVSDYAKILVGSVDKVSKDTRKFDQINVFEMIAVTATNLGWL